jgi:hypothetical protein
MRFDRTGTKPLRRLGAGALAIGAAVVVGCGGGGGSPEDTVQEFFDAARDQDAAATCELLTTASQDAAAAQAGGDCEAAFEDSGAADIPEEIEIGDVTEDGDTATVAVSAEGQDDEIPLLKEDDEWKIDLLGGATAPPEATAPEDAATTAPEGEDTSSEDTSTSEETTTEGG